MSDFISGFMVGAIADIIIGVAIGVAFKPGLDYLSTLKVPQNMKTTQARFARLPRN